jgi:hypothetical protein
MIAKVILILLLVLAIPWAISTWWRLMRARGPRERSFIGRSSLGVAIFTMVAAAVLALLKGHNLLIALPIIGVGGFALRYGLRKGRAEALAADADPVLGAKPARGRTVGDGK